MTHLGTINDRSGTFYIAQRGGHHPDCEQLLAKQRRVARHGAGFYNVSRWFEHARSYHPAPRTKTAINRHLYALTRKEIQMEQVLKSLTLDYFGNGKHKISPEKFFDMEKSLLLDVRSMKPGQVLKAIKNKK